MQYLYECGFQPGYLQAILDTTYEANGVYFGPNILE
jgi:hypothetical protein